VQLLRKIDTVAFTKEEAKSLDLLGVYALALPSAASMLCGAFEQQKIDEQIRLFLWLAVQGAANNEACGMALKVTCQYLEVLPPSRASKALQVHAIAVSIAAIYLYETHKNSASYAWLFYDWDYSRWVQFLVLRGRDRHGVISPCELQVQLQKNLEIISK